MPLGSEKRDRAIEPRGAPGAARGPAPGKRAGTQAVRSSAGPGPSSARAIDRAPGSMVGPGFGGPVSRVGATAPGPACELAPDGKSDEHPADGPGYASAEAEIALQQAAQLADAVASAAIPAFRRAVDAIDPGSAVTAAHAAIEGIDAARAAIERAAESTAEADPYASAMSPIASPPGQRPTAPRAPAPATSTAEPVDPIDIVAARDLEADRLQIAARLAAVEDQALRALGPQIFRGNPIRSGTEIPLGAKEDPLQMIVREASTTVDLLTTARYVRHLLGPDPATAPGPARKEAATAVEARRGRPLDFRFLCRLLEAEGIMETLWDEEGESGRSLKSTRTAVTDQALATGDLGDVGAWDAAERHPMVDNVLARIRNAGVRDGLVLRVTGQELRALTEAGAITPENLSASLERIGMVLGNDRIDVSSKVLSKLYPQSDIEQYFGDVDPVTGEVNVKNDHPISSGYVADAERIPSSSKADNQTMRDVLGVDGAATFYRKYLNDNDPLFEVLFRVNVELEVPLPQTEAPGIPLGGMDPTTHHLAGTGITKGGVPEGKLPGRVPIEILDIKSVGTPRTAFPSRGAKSAWSGTPELASDRGPPSAFLPSPSGHGIEEPHRDEE